jgi:hypothetical protein
MEDVVRGGGDYSVLAEHRVRCAGLQVGAR